MDLPVFYAPPENVVDETIELPGEESHHLAVVMRLKPAAMVLVVDGLGLTYRAEVITADRSRARLRFHSCFRNFGEPVVRLTLAAGLSTGSKFDTVVQKGTELGVRRFVPLVTEKSKVAVDEPRRAARRTARLENVALAAIKQCRRSYRPDIALPTAFTDFLKETDPDSCNLIFHPAAGAGSLSEIKLGSELKRLTILVGPEAGLTDDEVRQAVSAGFKPVSLGPRVLRTETAGPVACALVMQALGELR